MSLPKQGSVSVSALPIESEIKIDHKVVGKSAGEPFEVNRLSVGDHDLVVTFDGHHEYTKTFQVYYHRTTHLELSLIPISNTLYITTYPEGAKIYFNRKKVKQLSPVKLDSIAVGNYSLKAKLAGYHHAFYGGYLEPSSFVDIEIDMVPIQRMEAIVRSLVLPSEGQRFLGHPIKGWAYKALQTAAIGYTVYTFSDYISKRSDYQSSLDNYYEAVRIDYGTIDFWLGKNEVNIYN